MNCIHISGQKNYCWVWTAIDRNRHKFIHLVLGSRGTETGKELYCKIPMSPTTLYMTDYWKPYADFLPLNRHIQSKKETFTVEGYNSIMRHFLARLRRKSKCYSKSVLMLKYSLLLLFEKWNNELSILN
jgi:insertion element IS1 protein InsB